ncbi:MAG: aldolase/citrate lyase family protein [Burkholderiales bacterium]
MEIRHPLDNRLPAMLKSGKPISGIFNGIPSAAIVEMCAYAGFDFIIIDNEHGSADFETTEHMLRAARASGIVPLVRCFTEDIARVLDMGASGVQIPMVNTAEQARDLVRRVRYPGVGQRGSAFSSRAAGFGAFGGAGHTKRSNEGIALVAMIETPEAVANASAIASVEGIDAVFVGPNDLSHSMGFANEWSRPEVQKEIEKAIRAVAAAGKCAGTLALTPEEAKKVASWGANYLVSVTTSIITKAFKEAAGADRNALVQIEY